MPLRSFVLLISFAISASAACSYSSERILCDPQLAAEPAKPVIPSNQISIQEIKPRFQIKAFHLAEMLAVTGMAMDVASSWGCAEANPLLRSADGKFGGRGLAVKLGITGGIVGIAHLLHRKYPSLERPLGFALGLSGASLHAVAIRNSTLRCH